MKKIIVIFSIIFICNKLVAQTIPNSGFELWDLNLTSEPANYSTSNTQLVLQYSASPNVVRIADAYHGSYAVQFTTVAIKGDTISGLLTNSIGNPARKMGGIPFNQKATGMRLYYKSSIPAGDSAIIGCIFKKKGNLIGFYAYKIVDTVNTYTLLAETFSPALVVTPDTIIFAAFSSNVLGGKKIYAGSSIEIDSLSLTGVTAQPDLLNGDFENWRTDTAFTLPGWQLSFPGSSQTTDAVSGNYALQLQTEINPNKNKDSAQASSATTTNSYTLKADTLAFYYKYAPAVITDTANVNLKFKNSGIVFDSVQMNLPAELNYTLAQLPFNIGAVPDSMVLSFLSSSKNNSSVANIGSTLKIDSIYFKSQTSTGMKPVLITGNSVLINPNPATDEVTVLNDEMPVNEVLIENMLGQIVIDKKTDSTVPSVKVNIDVSALPMGLYFITTLSGDRTETGKIIVVR